MYGYIGSRVPWYVKIPLKIAVSRMSAGYAFRRRLGIFRHGAMDKPAYALDVFHLHFQRAKFARKGKRFVCLELGPGDSLFSGVIAHAYGAYRSYLVDASAFASTRLENYVKMYELLSERGLPIPDLANIKRVEDVLDACGIVYATRGVESLAAIPSESVDLIWSQAVLEHIRKRELAQTLRELRRIIRKDGVCSHRIDLRDHLGGSLNNLRFSDRIWESELVARSGFYTNRLGFSRMRESFCDAGFRVEVVGIERWENRPTPRECLAKEFRSLSDDELCISGFDALLYPV